MFVVHAGNRLDLPGRGNSRFAASAVQRVTGQVETLLAALKPRRLVSAPAAGADLIVLGVAQRLGIPVHIVLGLPIADFVAQSVADHQPVWMDRFERVIQRAADSHIDVVESLDFGHLEQWWFATNSYLIRRVGELAAEFGDPTIVALTIRSLQLEVPPSATDDLALKASAAGWPVITVDPGPPAHAASKE